jgi:hypothetical protein
MKNMFDEWLDKVTRKTMNKSAKTVKKEVKKKIDDATTGKNAQRLLIAALIVSGVALIFSIGRNSRPVTVNVYNNSSLA